MFQSEDTKIVKFDDKYASEITRFRKRLLQEIGTPDNYLDLDMNYSQTQEYCAKVGITNHEEAWKFGTRKWQATQFSRILGIWNKEDGVVGISGSQVFGPQKCLRTSMHLYTLKMFRAKYRNYQFAKEGLFATHLEDARSLHLDYAFFSVYPHNKVLRAHVKNLAYRRISPGTGKVDFLDDLIFVRQPVYFNQVLQYIFIYLLNEKESYEVPPDFYDSAGKQMRSTDRLGQLKI
jgi:hypothetical protein